MDDFAVTKAEAERCVPGTRCLRRHGNTAEAAPGGLSGSGSSGNGDMVPTINGMMVVGVVALPGMMTGQILSGVDPLVAVRYQIVILFLIAAANTLGCVGTALLCYRRLFNNKHQIEASQIVRRGP